MRKNLIATPKLVVAAGATRHPIGARLQDGWPRFARHDGNFLLATTDQLDAQNRSDHGGRPIGGCVNSQNMDAAEPAWLAARPMTAIFQSSNRSDANFASETAGDLRSVFSHRTIFVSTLAAAALLATGSQ